MKNRFYLFLFLVLTIAIGSQADVFTRPSGPTVGGSDEEVTDSTVVDSLVIDSLITDSINVDSIVIDTLIIDTLVIDSLDIDTLTNDSLVIDSIDYVAIVNADSLCKTLTEAFYVANDTIDADILLVDDSNLGLIVIRKGLTVSLDLNGHKVSIDSLGIYNYGTLTITDSSEEGLGTIRMDQGNVGMIYNYGELTIDKGSFICNAPEVEGTDNRRSLITYAGSKTTIKGGYYYSPYQAICLNGEVTIDAGEFVSSGNCEVAANYSTTAQVIINDGIFSNTAEKPEGNDQRRCLWTCPGSKTLINGGTYTSENQALFLIGETTIEDGTFVSTGNNSVVNYSSANGELVINGGTFQNLGQKPAEGTDSRRSLFTNKGTTTIINGGTFLSNYQVIALNGDATISDGEFTSTGNINVIGNYNTTGELTISGGTFANEGEVDEGEMDSRRCLWTSKDTNTTISGGTFTNNSTAQTITIYGNALISGGTLENKGQGSGIASNGSVEVTNCRISAWNMMICWNGATLVCSGGLYSAPIPSILLAEGCECVDNTDPETMETYPYKVTKGGLPGDVNGDGSVDVADISSVISFMAGSAPEYEITADVNGDGTVDVADISSIISIMAGA